MEVVRARRGDPTLSPPDDSSDSYSTARTFVALRSESLRGFLEHGIECQARPRTSDEQSR